MYNVGVLYHYASVYSRNLLQSFRALFQVTVNILINTRAGRLIIRSSVPGREIKFFSSPQYSISWSQLAFFQWLPKLWVPISFLSMTTESLNTNQPFFNGCWSSGFPPNFFQLVPDLWVPISSLSMVTEALGPNQTSFNGYYSSGSQPAFFQWLLKLWVPTSLL